MPLHPRFVHFPVALLFLGSALLLLSLVWAQKDLRRVGWANLFIGWLSLFPAIVTGLIDQGRLDPTPEVTQTVNRHITGGIALLVIYGYLLYERLRLPSDEERSPSARMVVGLILGLVVLVITGELGGRLAYLFR